MFTLHLARVGKTGTRQASKELSISPTFLDHVVMDLRQAGVIDVKKGPGGGATLRKDATLLDVVAALEKDVILNDEDVRFYEAGASETHKKSLLFLDMAASSMKHLLSQTIKEFATKSVL
jgi:DNA-binding IscR family transcriptional regulator